MHQQTLWEGLYYKVIALALQEHPMMSHKKKGNRQMGYLNLEEYIRTVPTIPEGIHS